MFQIGTRSILISLLFVPFVALCLLPPFAEAAFRGKGIEYGSESSSYGGDHEVGVLIASTTAEQEHLNTLIRRANWRTGGISTAEMSRAWEFALQYGYRPPSSMIEWLLRPSYFYQKTTGSNSGGSYDYGVTGFTLFPLARIIPLENNFMKFYVQGGIGYGRAYGKVQEADASIEMQGDAYGSQVGLGLEFCYESTHCLTVESNYRYMKMARNFATAASGTFDSSSITQALVNSEVEMSGYDLALQMGGLQFALGYTAHF
jgi:hypothetical protein